MESNIMQNLTSFGGVKRRFSEHEFGSQIIIDDYAHHPIEVTATIDSVRKKYPNKEVVAIFQPHTYTRTSMFLNRSEEHTSELQSRGHLVCRLLLEKKK